MDEGGRRETGPEGNGSEEFAPTIPSKHLPPVAYREMPEPLALYRIFGPSVVLVSVGLASAGFVLWPYITTRIGPVYLWAAVIAVLTQFFINMEIERYTLATGETAVTGFTRLWKPWGVIFVGIAIATSAWPGLTASAATAAAYAYTLDLGAVLPIAVVALGVIGVLLTIFPVVYRTVESAAFFKVAAVLIFLAAAVYIGMEASYWADLPAATFDGISRPLGILGEAEASGRLPADITAATILAALVFAGAGGTINLALSNWIRDKGFGMGAHMARVVSPLTGEEEGNSPAPGYMFPQDEENLSRWRTWWRNANREHFAGFFLIASLAIVIFSMLAYANLNNLQLNEGFNYISDEGAILSAEFGDRFGTFFWVIAAIVLLVANLGIIDYVSRLAADSLKVSFLSRSSFWSESKVYATVVWGMVVFGVIVLLLGLANPLDLFVISATLGAIAMSVYSVLLITLNRNTLPEAIKPRGFRLGAMGWAVVFSGSISVALVISLVRTFVTG